MTIYSQRTQRNFSSITYSLLFVTFNGIYSIQSTQSITFDTWNHAVVRYDAENCELTLFTNGTALGEAIARNGVENVNWVSVKPRAG